MPSLPRSPLRLVPLLLCALPTVQARAAEDDTLRDELARLRATVAEQSRRLEEQSRRIAALESGRSVSADALGDAIRAYVEAAADDPAAVSLPLRTRRRQTVTLYGHVRLDVTRDDSRPQDTQLIAWIRSEDPAAPASIGAPENDSDFTMHARQTRIGMDLAAPAPIAALHDAELSGKVEIDFYGGGSDSRNFVRMRQAYLALDWDDLRLLAGQSTDLIAPLYLSVNTDMAMWGAGNVGDRRPQVRLDYHRTVGDGTLYLQGALALAGAVDQDDQDLDGYLDGETSGEPALQGRVAYRTVLAEDTTAFQAGVWGHYAEEDPATDIARRSRFESNLFGVDLVLPVYRKTVWLKGEWWRGKNMDDVRGAILQGVDLATGREIRGSGGWVEVVVQAADWLTLHAGHGSDDPDDEDLPTGGRAENIVWFAAARATFDDFCVGLEYLDWTTEYVGFGDGTDHRVTLFLAYRF